MPQPTNRHVTAPQRRWTEVGETTIPVTVGRHVGHTVAYKVDDVVLEAHFYSVEGDRVIGPVVQNVSATLRFEERDACHFGAPVDRKAVVTNPDGTVARHPDGSVVMRDDGAPGAPEGRKPTLPSFIGDQPGQLRGVGHSWLSKVTGVEEKTTRAPFELGCSPSPLSMMPALTSSSL